MKKRIREIDDTESSSSLKAINDSSARFSSGEFNDSMYDAEEIEDMVQQNAISYYDHRLSDVYATFLSIKFIIEIIMLVLYNWQRLFFKNIS